MRYRNTSSAARGVRLTSLTRERLHRKSNAYRPSVEPTCLKNKYLPSIIAAKALALIPAAWAKQRADLKAIMTVPGAVERCQTFESVVGAAHSAGAK